MRKVASRRYPHLGKHRLPPSHPFNMNAHLDASISYRTAQQVKTKMELTAVLSRVTHDQVSPKGTTALCAGRIKGELGTQVKISTKDLLDGCINRSNSVQGVLGLFATCAAVEM